MKTQANLPKRIAEKFQRWKLIWIGVFLGLFLYVVDVFVDTHGFGEGTLLHQFFRPEGMEIWTRALIFCLSVAFGAYGQFLLRRQLSARQSLRQNEVDLQFLFEHLPEAAILTDDNFNIVDLNVPAEALLKRKRSELAGASFESLFLSDNLAVKDPRRAKDHESGSSQFSSQKYLVLDSDKPVQVDVQTLPMQLEARKLKLMILRDRTERDKLKEAYQDIAGGISVAGESLFRHILRYLSEKLDVACAFVGQVNGENLDQVTTIALFADGDFVDNFTYDLKNTPCNNVIGGSSCVYGSDVQAMFPQAKFLADLSIASYIGTPLNDANGKPIGLLVLLDRKPITDASFFQSLIEIFAVHAAAELERSVAEIALRESEALLRATLESTGDGILVVNSQGKVIQTNGHFAELWRIPDEIIQSGDDQKLINYVLDQLVDPNAFVAKVEKLYQSPEEDNDTLYFKDGRVFDRYSCPLTLNDELTGRVWSFRDVTERGQAEAALKESEDLFRSLIDQAPFSIELYDTEGNWLHGNTAWENLWELKPEEVLGKFNIFEDEQLLKSGITGLFRKALSGEIVRVPDFEYDPVQAVGKGRTRWLSSTFYSLQTDDGKLRNVVIAHQDITERKRNETIQSVLYQISEATSGSISLDELFEAIQEQLGRLIDTKNFYVALYDEKAGHYNFPYIRDQYYASVDNIPPQKLKRSLTEYVRRNGKPILLTGEEHQRLIEAGEVEMVGRPSKIWMGIPLFVADKVIGVVAVQSYTDRGLYTDQDMDVVSIVAGSIAMAIERRQAEDKLRESTHQLRESQRVASIGSYLFDIKTGIGSNSDILNDLLGVDENFITDIKGWMKIIHPEQREEMASYFANEVLAKRQNFDKEYRIIRQNDREERWVHGKGELITDGDGNLAQMIGTIQDITDRKEVEREIELLSRFPDENSEPVLRVNSEGALYYANKASEVLVKKWITSDGDKLPASLMRSITNVVSTGRTYDFEEVFDERVFEIRCVPIEKHGYINLYGRDITKRKRAEEKLRVREAQLSGILKYSPSVIFLKDTQGRYEFISESYEDLFHISDEEIRGKTDYDVFPAEVAQVLRENDRKVIETGSNLTLDEEVPHDDGIHSYLSLKFPVRDAGGNISGVCGIATDITDRKQVEEELKKGEARLSEAQRIAGVGSWEYNFQTKQLVASDEMHRIFGLDLKRKTTRSGTFSKTIHPEDKKRFGEVQRAAIHEKKSIDLDYRIVLHDGTIKYVHEHAQVICDRDSAPLRLLGTTQDVTEHRKAEQDRNAMEARLRQSQRLETIGTLAGGIAHDFNNILTPILGHADMAMISVDKDHVAREDLERVIKAAHRAKDLVNQILTFSRQDEQGHKPLEVHLIIKETLELLRGALPATIKIRQNIDKYCGKILADPSQIHSVLMNLCTNAFQAMKDSGGELDVTLASDTEYAKAHPEFKGRELVRLTIRDSGSGMSKDVMDRIFEPFYTTKEVGEGTGLGLSVVHGIVTNHGGVISVESEAGKGTTFNIYLPKVETQQSGQTAPAEEVRGGSERLLLVDDQVDVTATWKRILEVHGYQVTVFNDSHEALACFTDHPDSIDLVICDQTMPEMTGAQLALEILAIRPELPIIMISGYSDVISSEGIHKLGIRDFLQKPLASRELNLAIRRQLDQEKLNEDT